MILIFRKDIERMEAAATRQVRNAAGLWQTWRRRHFRHGAWDLKVRRLRLFRASEAFRCLLRSQSSWSCLWIQIHKALKLRHASDSLMYIRGQKERAGNVRRCLSEACRIWWHGRRSKNNENTAILQVIRLADQSFFISRETVIKMTCWQSKAKVPSVW